ncbi:hypothetical protein GCM10007880_65670 [Mesorhizobium amorphae]|uniref:hypothetical protein n=1 Tax=Mesorhizobium amorphae TaxID=71433 RepID=UPI00235CB921|nr:hypothetical protein [Mesorhizobium amorphae]GLR46049.1 hypothetical protein GCM10007880_65670 [Mesorhizobium amorphae]
MGDLVHQGFEGGVGLIGFSSRAASSTIRDFHDEILEEVEDIETPQVPDPPDEDDEDTPDWTVLEDDASTMLERILEKPSTPEYGRFRATIKRSS